MTFRDEMDKWHYFGSMGLSFVLTLLFALILSAVRPGNPDWQYWVLGYVYGFLMTNVLGLIMELLEHYVFPSWKNDVYWRDKPKWMKRYFSGDKFDKQDISLNFLGSSIIHPIIMLIKDYRRTKNDS